jgi:hypothetical protein
MPHPFVEENTTSRQRLESLIGALTEEDFGRTTADGWTVSALLAHLAFWDLRVLVLLRRWQTDGVDESPVDPHMINDSLKPLCLALDPPAAVELCLSSAQAVDAELEKISPDLVAAIEASPNHFRFNRGHHRHDHLGEIERLLGRAAPAP